jgi:hypothetical protein
LIENHAKLFQGGSGPAEVGKELSWESYDEETGDTCNLIFTKSELDGEAKKVVERMKEFNGSRLEIILLQVTRGRAHSLKIVRDESTISWIDFSLDLFHDPGPPWSKADFIAVCVLLQGSAKSLLDGNPSVSKRQAKLNFWREKFSAFIYNEIPPDRTRPLNRDGDFVIKWHATVIISNPSLSDSHKLTHSNSLSWTTSSMGPLIQLVSSSSRGKSGYFRCYICERAVQPRTKRETNDTDDLCFVLAFMDWKKSSKNNKVIFYCIVSICSPQTRLTSPNN